MPIGKNKLHQHHHIDSNFCKQVSKNGEHLVLSMISFYF